MQWMPLIGFPTDVPRGTTGRCGGALVNDTSEPSEGSGRRVFHVEHPRQGHLAGHTALTTEASPEESVGGRLRITQPSGAVVRRRRAERTAGEGVPYP